MVNPDRMLQQMYNARKQKPQPKNIPYPEIEVRQMILKTREVLMSQPMLIEIEAPVKICGDTHGQLYETLRLFEYGGFPPAANYLFLGDYVDRGPQNIEVTLLMFCYKVKFPENFFILRGNHETASINRVYGFYDECKRRYNVKMWKTFSDCFNCLPVCGLVEDKILCMHGGISPDINHFDQIRRTARPCDIPNDGFLCDLMWADPDPKPGWVKSERGVSWTFGADALRTFLGKFDLDLVARAHQVMEDGYEFFGGRKCVTIFSAPNYCGTYDNSGAIMTVDENLVCSFVVLRPTEM